MHAILKLFTDRKFLLPEGNIWQFGNFMNYFLNKLTPYMRENGLKLFSIVKWTIHIYDFRRCGEFFIFSKTFCRFYSGKRILGLPVFTIY